MNTTGNLWEMLCKDLQTQRTGAQAKDHALIAQRFFETASEVFVTNSPRLCSAIEIAGDVCQASGDFSSAIRYFRDGLAKSLESKNQVSAARVSAKLGLLLDQTGDASAAKYYYEQAISLYDQIHDHSQHCMLLNQLASLCWGMGERDEAVRNYQLALDMAAKLHGDTHPEVALCANNFGVACTQMGNHEMAERLHMQALGVREKCFGSHHPDVAQSMANLAVVYHGRGNYDKAQAFYKAALKTYERFPQKHAADRETVKANYEALIRRMERKASE